MKVLKRDNMKFGTYQKFQQVEGTKDATDDNTKLKENNDNTECIK